MLRRTELDMLGATGLVCVCLGLGGGGTSAERMRGLHVSAKAAFARSASSGVEGFILMSWYLGMECCFGFGGAGGLVAAGGADEMVVPVTRMR